ncbi:glucosylglycerol-phosphate synthase [Lyngbya confervoides]|uniref:Glucosylglycerol-phosphate synthase n=1 Tax=Lyngbya confervoides BDU141951 TaxID=1574623 RepID=A0ABD4T4I3_9CYAN|nr:glucosylglycerol-phosphate synthase [Lyngbya confervoides]MCM1983437.1 glucosylglycerol-phosphate synthase [Lyngbya confervoides BDU141951]
MTTAQRSSLVILYHREPFDEVVENGKVIYREKKSPNGILPTLKRFFANAEQSTWIAWKQVTAKQQESFQSVMTFGGLGDRCIVKRIPLKANQVKDFYHITSKEAFWPILHSFPWQFSYGSSNWDNFREINRLFAEAAIESAAEDALIWIHDYNLWLAPYFIRQQLPSAKIVFFHHTPFPSADIFNVLPWREEIVDSLLCCDVCGFHIPRYVENFVGVARSSRAVKILKQAPVPDYFVPTGLALAEPSMTTQLEYNGRIVHLSASPVGTDPDHLRQMASQPEVTQKMADIRAQVRDGKLILSAGRVDYVKGTKELLHCYERLLERRPELQGKVNLVVAAAAPATGMRVYKTAKSDIEQLVGKINGRFAQLNWTPIVLFTSSIPQSELLALFKAADIAWVTPLRDGLNLVAKEYVAVHGTDSGVLILSEFVGAAVELPDALLTNPYSSQEMDQAIDKALAMDLDEQQKRMQRMSQSVDRFNVQWWADHLLGADAR